MNDLLQRDEISDIWGAIDNLSPVKHRDVFISYGLTGTDKWTSSALMLTEVSILI